MELERPVVAGETQEFILGTGSLALLARRLIQDFPEYNHYDSERSFKYNNIDQQNRNPLGAPKAHVARLLSRMVG